MYVSNWHELTWHKLTYLAYGRLSGSLVTCSTAKPHVHPNRLDATISPTYCPVVASMDPFQSVGLQSSWMTMVAHGVTGVVPPAPSIAIASTTNREYVESTTTNIANTVLNIAKDASQMFKNVPYITALAGIVIQIINIREVREQSGERNALP